MELRSHGPSTQVEVEVLDGSSEKPVDGENDQMKRAPLQPPDPEQLKSIPESRGIVDTIRWYSKITMEEAARMLERKFYPFKDVSHSL